MKNPILDFIFFYTFYTRGLKQLAINGRPCIELILPFLYILYTIFGTIGAQGFPGSKMYRKFSPIFYTRPIFPKLW